MYSNRRRTLVWTSLVPVPGARRSGSGSVAVGLSHQAAEQQFRADEHGDAGDRGSEHDQPGSGLYVFRGCWDGDPDTFVLTEGTALAFIDPTDMRGLPMSPLARYAALSGLAADLEEQARADGIREMAAAGIIVHDGRFLNVRRSADTDPGGTWEIPGGLRQNAESLLDCLLRHACEATGLAVQSVDRYLGHIDHVNISGHISRRFVFTLRPEKPGPIPLTGYNRHQWIRATDDLPSLPRT
jgi:8-oxo-dGTP diphosphatase